MISGAEDTVDCKWCGGALSPLYWDFCNACTSGEGAGGNRDDRDTELMLRKTAVIVRHRLKTALPLLLHFQFINIILPIFILVELLIIFCFTRSNSATEDDAILTFRENFLQKVSFYFESF